MKINPSEWMRYIDGKKELFSLNIPGSHDCAAQYVQYPHISKCHDKSIYEQLNIGIRSLDVRVKPKGERLLMVHSIAKVFNTPNRLGKQMDFADVLSQCYTFLDENKSEAIIIQFKNDTGKDFEKSFDNLFYTYIKDNENRWYTKNKLPSLDEARGKIVLIRRCRMNESNGEYTKENTGIDFSCWVEQPELVCSALVLNTHSKDNEKFIIQDRFKYKAKAKWNECVKPFLDERGAFDGKYIICYLSTAGGLAGPKKNADFINSEFMKYPIDKKYLGTIYLDFPCEKLCKKIIKSNLENL